MKSTTEPSDRRAIMKESQQWRQTTVMSYYPYYSMYMFWTQYRFHRRNNEEYRSMMNPSTTKNASCRTKINGKLRCLRSIDLSTSRRPIRNYPIHRLPRTILNTVYPSWGIFQRAGLKIIEVQLLRQIVKNWCRKLCLRMFNGSVNLFS